MFIHPSCPNVLVNSSYYFNCFLSTDGFVLFKLSSKSCLVIIPISTFSFGYCIQFPGSPSYPGLHGTYFPSTNLNFVAVCNLRTGQYTASRTNIAISLPLKSYVRFASSTKSAYVKLFLLSFMPFLSMPNLAQYSGSEMYILRQNLLRIAGSKAQGKFVAPRTNTPVSSWPTPCI